MRLSEELQERYFLSDRGVKVLGRGIFWTAVVNLIDMFGIAFLFLLADRLIGRLTDAGPAELPGPVPILPLLALYLLVSLLAHMLQYRATYTAVYDEAATLRMGIGNRLRSLPLSFFGERDLTDLAETIMGDAAKLEHVWSHVLGYLFGSLVSTASPPEKGGLASFVF